MAELEALRQSCTRFLGGHGNRSTAEQLAAIPAETVEDHYGEGGVVADLEHEVAELLGKPAAVFMPSGTMTQQIALRVHADRRNRRTVLCPPALPPCRATSSRPTSGSTGSTAVRSASATGS